MKAFEKYKTEEGLTKYEKEIKKLLEGRYRDLIGFSGKPCGSDKREWRGSVTFDGKSCYKFLADLPEFALHELGYDPYGEDEDESGDCNFRKSLPDATLENIQASINKEFKFDQREFDFHPEGGRLDYSGELYSGFGFRNNREKLVFRMGGYRGGYEMATESGCRNAHRVMCDILEVGESLNERLALENEKLGLDEEGKKQRLLVSGLKLEFIFEYTKNFQLGRTVTLEVFLSPVSIRDELSHEKEMSEQIRHMVMNAPKKKIELLEEAFERCLNDDNFEPLVADPGVIDVQLPVGCEELPDYMDEFFEAKAEYVEPTQEQKRNREQSIKLTFGGEE